MKLGNHTARSDALNRLFGFPVYTDDNEVVAMEGDQSTLAHLYPTNRKNELRVVFEDARTDVTIEVPGAGKERHER